MKHFTITTDTEAAALRPFASEPLKVGHIITPSVGIVTHTAWDDYPESDALTFEECMAIVRDEVTEEVLREVGEFTEWNNRFGSQIKCYIVEEEYGTDALIEVNENREIDLTLDCGGDCASINIPNPTATKIKLLAAILRGEKI
jgi:hypothetical protein